MLALCPECQQETRFLMLGSYRMICRECGAVVKVEEIKRTDDG